MPIRKYPVSAIDEGIKLSLENAKRLLDFAIRLHDQGNEVFSYIVYSFALEEFGKAVLLKRNKQSHNKEIRDEVTFKEHGKKLEAAVLELNNSLIAIPVYEELEPTGEIKVVDGEIVFEGSLEFQEMKQIGTFLSWQNRVDLLFVDYDEKNGKWQTWENKQLPLHSSVEHGLSAFKQGLEQWIKSNGLDISTRVLPGN